MHLFLFFRRDFILRGSCCSLTSPNNNFSFKVFSVSSLLRSDFFSVRATSNLRVHQKPERFGSLENQGDKSKNRGITNYSQIGGDVGGVSRATPPFSFSGVVSVEWGSVWQEMIVLELKIVNCPHCGKILPRHLWEIPSSRISENIKCPECGSRRLYRDGIRYTNSGNVQRYLCRDCGYRFSSC